MIMLIIGCDYKPASFGDFEKIVVFSDTLLFRQIQTELEQTFDQFIYTPHLERSFYLDLQPLSAFDTYQTRRNLLFIGLLDSDNEVSDFLNEALSIEVKEAVAEGKVFEIFKENVFATGQVVMFLPAVDIGSLKRNLSDRSEMIFKRLNTLYFERLASAMYMKGEQISLEQYLAEKTGWKIRVQHDYELVKEDKDGHYIWLRRLNPDRCFFIYRLKGNKMAQSGDWMYNLRDSLGTAFYEGDSIDREDTYLQFIDFLGYQAIKLTGVWQNHQYYIGGPFRTYFFYDEESGFTYVLDLSVTAPGQRKKPFIDQLEVMAQTFEIVSSKKM